MINEIKTYKIDLEGVEGPITLRLDFNAMIKLQKETGNSLMAMEKLMTGDLEMIPVFIKCLADRELSIDFIKERLNINHRYFAFITNLINELISDSVIGEIDENAEEVTEKN